MTTEGCVIRNHTGNGLEFFPNATSRLLSSNTLFADNGGNGALVQPVSGGSAKVALARFLASTNSQDGVFVAAPLSGTMAHATVRDSVVAHNSGTGISLLERFCPAGHRHGDRRGDINIGTGISALGLGATVRVGQSVVTANALGLNAANSFLDSYGDDDVDGNTADGFFTGNVTDPLRRTRLRRVPVLGLIDRWPKFCCLPNIVDCALSRSP